jgi:Xaa-Pro aminopeptidase
MPAYPDFPAEEYEQRFARARGLMEEANLDGLLITDELNYVYFTGHRSQQNPIDKIRPYVYVLPRERDGVLITMPFETEQVRNTTWVDDVRLAGLTNRADEIAAVLKDMGLANGRIGAELGSHQYLGISYNEFSEVQQELPNAEFADAAQVLLRLRAVKSPLEVEYLRRAAEIVATAQADTFAYISAGITELEVMRKLRTRLAELGGENVTFMWVVSTVNPSLGAMNGIATDRKLKPGDMLSLDCGVEYHGYCSDIARCASVGEPSDEVAGFYIWMMEVRHKCNDLLRAGNTPRDVVTTCREAIAERGLETTGVGRIGHGVGLQSTEFPSLAIDEDIIFQPGMVFACNPNFVRPFGFVNCEDEWLVGSGAPALLSAPIAPNEIPVIPLT